MRILKNTLLLLILLAFLSPNLFGSYLTRNGSKLYDSQGTEVRLTGVNWFGFETSNLLPHGLWCRDYQSMLQQIKDLGFNCVRIPWCNSVISSTQNVNVNNWGPDSYNGAQPMNSALENKTPLQALDIIIDAAQALDLKIILDNHSRVPDGYMNETLWYTSTFTEQQWINDWVFMANRYANNNTVVGFDLNNEPHGNASWGDGNVLTDWRIAAQTCAVAIQQVNPDVLILVEGVENCNGTSYWWGGNLRGVASKPIAITYMNKLVYSSHEYGPEVYNQTWFSDPDFPANMDSIWNANFGYIMATDAGHILIGEFGIKDQSAFNGNAGTWFSSFLNYMAADYSWTFWCFNPNSGDTEGILQNDWVSVNQWKMDSLSPYLAPLINNVITGIGQNQPSNSTLQLTSKNWPNPFKVSTHISFTISQRSNVSICIYHSNGAKMAEILNKNMEPGTHSIAWDGNRQNGQPAVSGTYFYTVNTNGQTTSNKIVLLK